MEYTFILKYQLAEQDSDLDVLVERLRAAAPSLTGDAKLSPTAAPPATDRPPPWWRPPG